MIRCPEVRCKCQRLDLCELLVIVEESPSPRPPPSPNILSRSVVLVDIPCLQSRDICHHSFQLDLEVAHACRICPSLRMVRFGNACEGCRVTEAPYSRNGLYVGNSSLKCIRTRKPLSELATDRLRSVFVGEYNQLTKHRYCDRIVSPLSQGFHPLRAVSQMLLRVWRSKS